MIRRHRYARLPPASAAAGSDTEALQTDVMRFMSSIGLCLMAVFALVHGIPAEDKGEPAQPLQTSGIRQESKAQQRELQAEVQALKSEQGRTQHVLSVAQRQLEQGRNALVDLKQASIQKQQDLTELRGRLLDTQAQLNFSRKEIEALKQQSRQPVATAVIEKPSPAAAAQKPVPARRGFSLRFASTAALDRLVAAGSVVLFGMADQQAWRLSIDVGRPAVTRASVPVWFHEMSAATVPAHYIHSLEKAAGGPGQTSVVWGVQLPAATKAAIALITRAQQGGTLVIRSDGQVMLEK